MAEIEFKCKRCKRIFSYDVGRIAFPSMAPGSRPQFEKNILCNGCGVLTMDEVELTEWGQTQLSELHFRDMARKQMLD